MAVTKILEERTSQSVQRQFTADTLNEMLQDQSELRPGDHVHVLDQTRDYVIMRPGGETNSVIPVGERAGANTVTAVIDDAVGTTQAISISLKDMIGVGRRYVTRVWLTESLSDLSPTATPPDGGVTVDAGVLIDTPIAGTLFVVLADESGGIELTIDNVGNSATWEGYVIVEGNNGRIYGFGPFAIPHE